MPDKISWLWFALGSAFFAGLTAILGKIGVTEINSNLATLIRTVVILALSALVVAGCGEWEPLDRISRRGMLMLVLSGLATGLSWLCYYRALQLQSASRVAPIDKLSIVFVILLAWLYLGEPMSARMLLGCALIVAGVLVLS